MKRKINIGLISGLAALAVALTIFGRTPTAIADLADELGDLEGYVIIAEEQIDKFKGCKYGKIIQFRSGDYVKCKEYGYQYAYYADAVILARSFGNKAVLSCKMVVEDEIYDVGCGQYIKNSIIALRRYCLKATGNTRTFCEHRLKLFEAIGLL